MSLPEMEARVKVRLWQAIAFSGTDISVVPREQMEKLVDVISKNVLEEIDQVIGQVVPQSVAAASLTSAQDEEEEQILWEGRPFLSIGTRYQITNERIRIIRGSLGKDREDIELVRVQDIDQSQSLSERLVNIGDIQIRSHDPKSPKIVLNNIKNPLEVHEILRAAVLKARKKHRMGYREEM